MVDRSTQEISIETPGTKGALCFMERPGFSQRIWAPQTFRITKSGDPLKVHCLAPGNREKTVIVEPSFPNSYALNALNGFVGGLYDYESGAMYTLPDKIVVDFSGITPGFMPQPDYQEVLDANPDIASMEEFRPGNAALQRDKYNGAIPLEPRKSEGELFGDLGISGRGQDTPAADNSEAGRDSASVEGAGEPDSVPASVSSARAAPPRVPSVPSGADPVESLTRQMNPSVFSPGSSVPPAPASSGFAGGTPSTSGGGTGSASGNPVSVYPLP